MAKKAATKQAEPIEKQMWKAADKLRKNIDAAEYKHIVLGLIFLKYISDAFDELYEKLQAGEGDFAGADPEDKDEYKAENVFFVPETARWTYLLTQAKQPDIGKTVDAAMDAIEKENPSLLDVLPKVFARYHFQMSDDESFEELLVDKYCDEPHFEIARPNGGEYFIRVRTIDPDGFIGPFAAAQSIDVPYDLYWLLALLPLLALLAL